MITSLPVRKVITFLLVVFFYTNTASAGIEPIPSGSFIINMGVVPQTYANGLKPWGMIWNLIHYYKVPVKWVINQTKVKDGTDFTYNGTDFKGGTFIILKKYRSAKVDSTINYWQTQGVSGITTTTDFNADVTYTIKYNPLWTFDFQNGKIALAYLTIAGIPTTSYPMKDPDALSDCDDLFVMPHADPTWGTHQNLLFWNTNNRGWLWYGCHAGSVIESTVNPQDSTQQMNFLTTTGLVNYADHGNPTPPYSYRYDTDPEMQFMGTVDAAVTNGSEQVYLPKLNGGWRPTTKVSVWDPSDADIPSLSNGEGAIIAYGRAFGDTAKGEVMFQAGHSFDKNNSAAVAAIRAFFNFSYLSTLDKIVTPVISGSITCTAGSASNYSATLPAGYAASNYSFHWSSNGSGTFSNEFGVSTSYIPSAVGTPTNYMLTVTITDGCGREYYQTMDITVSGVPPVALDRTAQPILNPPGTGPQPIGNLTPMAGTDSDGYVANYILLSLPANGVLYYDNDNNSSTADVAISSIPSGGLILSTQKMKSLKFDPNDTFGSTASFQYQVQDNTGLTSLNIATYTIPVNPPPVAQNFICTPVASNADRTSVCPFAATDNNSVVSYTVVSIPTSSKCSVYLYNALVTTGQVISPVQATQLTYKPSGTYIGYAEITYTATDNSGAVSNLATITLQMVNQAPVAQDIAAPNINNPVGSIQIAIPSLNATDLDGSISTYTITNAPASSQGILYYNNNGVYTQVTNNQVLTIAQASSLKFDPVDTYSGVCKFKFIATDNLGLASSIAGTYSIPVKKIVPVTNNINNHSVYAGAGRVNISNLSGTTADTAKTITSYIIKTIPSSNKGVVFYHASGSTYLPVAAGQEIIDNTMRFEPNRAYTGNVTFTYVAKDNAGLADPTPATYTIPVTNQAPSVTNITNTAIKDTAGTITIKPLAGTDADGTIASFVILTLPDPSTGVLSISGTPVTAGQTIAAFGAASLQFTPILHNSNDASFRFTAVDDLGSADASAATFTIPISLAPYKLAPVADTKTNTTLNLKTVSSNLLPLSGTDPDGVVVSFQVTKLNKANEGTLYLQGIPVVNNQVIPVNVANQLSFIPTGTFEGTSSFNYAAIDNDGNTGADAIFNIPLVNSIPVANDFTASQVATSATSLIPGLQASDTDGTILSYKILSLPSSGTLQYDSTGTGVYGTAKVNMVLNTVKAAKLRIIAGSTTGNTSFTFTATDNLNAISNVATYTIPIGSTGTNQKPIPKNITTLSIAYNAGISAINSLSATDADGTIIGYVIESIPPTYYGSLYYDSLGYYAIYRGIIKISAAQATTLKFTPSGTYTGNVTFTYKAIDNTNQYSNTEATYTIPLTNAAPVIQNITNPSIPSSNGPTLLTPLTANDNGTIVNYIITSLPNSTQGTLVMDGSPISLNQVIPAMDAGRLEFAPDINFSGNSSFKFTAVDNFSTIDITPGTFTIPVTNQAPVVDNKVSQVITNYIGTPAQAIPALTGVDNDGTISAYIIKTLPAGGKLYKNGTLISSIPSGGLNVTLAEATQLSFDPDDNFGGTTSFTYTAKDNSNNISVTPATYQILLNTPPVTNNISANAMYPAQPLAAIPALVGSDDGSVAFYSIVTLPDPNDGVLYLNNVAVTNLSQVDTLNATQINQLSFQPLITFDGAVFTYTATDNTGLIDVTPAVYSIPLSSIVLLDPLQVDILSFTGDKADVNNILRWTTSQEINSDHFDIERSADGVTFVKTGVQKASGNSSAKIDYSFTDYNVASTYFYRLKIVDRYGNTKYSAVVVIKRSVQSLLISKVTPNPFTNKIAIDIEAGSNSNSSISIYDLNGRVIKNMEVVTVAGLNHVEINDLGNLSSGTYFVKVKSNDSEIVTKIYKSR